MEPSSPAGFRPPLHSVALSRLRPVGPTCHEQRTAGPRRLNPPSNPKLPPPGIATAQRAIAAFSREKSVAFPGGQAL